MGKVASIVDDSLEMVELLEAILVSVDYKTYSFSDYDLAEKNIYFLEQSDIVILDYECPFKESMEDGGKRFYQAHANIIQPSQTILYSGGPGWTDSGLNGFLLQKPFHIKDLYDLVKHIEQTKQGE